MKNPFASVADVTSRLAAVGYLPDVTTSTVVFLAFALDRPILVEGPAGVGKTELARAVASATTGELLRLQCYEGLDESRALYEWDYSKQLLYTQLLRDRVNDVVGDVDLDAAVKKLRQHHSAFFADDFLLERPLLRALRSPTPCVLLIDEIDRADEAFEAFLLEVLSEYQITVPELGTLRARQVPQVLLTSNGTRELSDALRRRCLYHYLDYPTLAREIAIVKAALPEADTALVEEAVQFVQRLRREDLAKTPGIAETLDWVRALHRLGHAALPDDPHALTHTLACLLKTRNDRFQLGPDRVQQLLEGLRSTGVAVPSSGKHHADDTAQPHHAG
jgi:MoxR-like ATPase